MSKRLTADTWPIGKIIRFTGTEEQLSAIGICGTIGPEIAAGSAVVTATEGGYVAAVGTEGRAYALCVARIEHLFKVKEDEGKPVKESKEPKVKNPVRKKYRELGLQGIVGVPPEGALVRYIGRREALWMEPAARAAILSEAFAYEDGGLRIKPHDDEKRAGFNFNWYYITPAADNPFVLESDYQEAVKKASQIVLTRDNWAEHVGEPLIYSGTYAQLNEVGIPPDSARRICDGEARTGVRFGMDDSAWSFTVLAGAGYCAVAKKEGQQ